MLHSLYSFFVKNMRFVYSYPTPANISYMWNYGSLALLCLAVQIITGIFLVMYYMPDVTFAFFSVEFIMRDVDGGWLLRYLHSNGASMFFIVVYTHMLRGIYYGSYTRPGYSTVWAIGVIILFLMIGTGFLGYVLPWGQMSYWGATVITNLISAVPVIGVSVVEWIWGGFSVGNLTLHRFFTLHYLLPFILIVLSLSHVFALNIVHSSNPLGIKSRFDYITFHPYFSIKDIVGICVYGFVYAFFVFYDPNFLGHVDNYIEANPLVTPAHIVPEWYLLPFYAILRSVPDKLGGVVLMVFSIVGLIFLSFVTTSFVKSGDFKPIYRKLFWLFLVDSALLLWIGGKPAEDPFIFIGRISTVFYFLFIFVFYPISSYLESRSFDKIYTKT